ncbi:MAG: hypothetical protein LBT20_07595 [Clostridiales bacterium]|jgi:hypothetical protein|nr:hypothetical protein [Clostridiales bacterium]
MQTKDIIGRVVELKADFFISMFGEEQTKKIKENRPFVIIELLYKGKPQLFAIPLQTSIKDSLNKNFWDKLPARLETEIGYSRGMIYSSMIPITCNCVSKIKQPERYISSREEVMEKLFLNIINRIPERRNEPLPDNAKASYQYLRKQIMAKGQSCFNDESVRNAYYAVSKVIYNETYKKLNDGLSPDENGERKIVKKAQHYLDNYYLKTIQNQENKSVYCFVDMPNHYTDINQLMTLLLLYNPKT